MTITNDVEALGSAAFLSRMLQFGRSMFPIGAFAFSSGLESAIQKGIVTNAATLRAYARTALEQAARGDGIALIAAHRAATAGDIDTLAQINRPAGDSRASFLTKRGQCRFARARSSPRWVWRWWVPRCCRPGGNALISLSLPGCYPIALAINFAVQELPAKQAFVVHQYGVATTILGAALRLMKVRSTLIRRRGSELTEPIGETYEAAATARLSDMAGFAPSTDILAAIHTRAHVRLFP